MMNSFRFLLVCIFLLLLINGISAQNTDNSPIEKNSISANILGTASYVGLTYERLIADRVSVEVGIGLIGLGVGAVYYPFEKVKIDKLNPFVGLKFTNHAIIDGENKSATYLPVGVSFFSRYRLNLSADIGPSLFHRKSPGLNPTVEELELYPFRDYGLWGNLKIGFRF